MENRATILSTSGIAINDTGSRGFTPKRKPARRRVSQNNGLQWVVEGSLTGSFASSSCAIVVIGLSDSECLAKTEVSRAALMPFGISVQISSVKSEGQ
jgi:hypothetical protein